MSNIQTPTDASPLNQTTKQGTPFIIYASGEKLLPKSVAKCLLISPTAYPMIFITATRHFTIENI